jgi:soluble lytic murein transglycosylase-like protein
MRPSTADEAAVARAAAQGSASAEESGSNAAHSALTRGPAEEGSSEPTAEQASSAEDVGELASGAVATAAEVKSKSVTAADRDAKATAPSASRFARQFKIPVSLADQIHKAAVAEGIEPRVAFGLVQTESSFRRTVISSAGAVGYTQLLPSTARWIAPGTTRSQLFQPHTNLRVGFKYLRYLEKKYNGNMRLALTAYNRGPGTVDRLLKQGRNPENGYATKVLRSRG